MPVDKFELQNEVQHGIIFIKHISNLTIPPVVQVVLCS